MIKVNPKKIPGKWLEGYALDFHTISSTFIGYDEYGHEQFDTKRSDLGELLYLFKYKSDRSVVKEIAEIIQEFLARWKPPIEAIVPTPPSKKYRDYQPVLEIAKALSDLTRLPLHSGCVVKVKDTPELKSIHGYGERIQTLEDAFSITPNVLKDKTVLLLDDLFRSGATLSAVSNLLYTQGGVADVYALALTQTRSRS